MSTCTCECPLCRAGQHCHSKVVDPAGAIVSECRHSPEPRPACVQDAYIPAYIPAYSTDIAAARQVVERLRRAYLDGLARRAYGLDP